MDRMPTLNTYDVFSIESNEILMYKFFYAPNNLDYKHVAIHDLFMLTNVLLIRRVVQNNVDNFIEDPQCMYVSTYIYIHTYIRVPSQILQLNIPQHLLSEVCR